MTDSAGKTKRPVRKWTSNPWVNSITYLDLFLTKSTVFFKKIYQILTLKSTFQIFVEQKTLKKISVSTKDQPLFEAILYNKKLFEKVVVRRGGMFGNTKISSKVHLSTGSFKK